jgi:hypothetical protein
MTKNCTFLDFSLCSFIAPGIHFERRIFQVSTIFQDGDLRLEGMHLPQEVQRRRFVDEYGEALACQIRWVILLFECKYKVNKCKCN